MPQCSKCRVIKRKNEFYNRSGRRKLSDWCADCHAAYQRAHRAAAPERARLHLEQEGLCRICFQPERARHGHTLRPKRLSLDIGPSGEVRGLLCAACNTGIGMFRDDPIILRRALEYVLHLGVVSIPKPSRAVVPPQDIVESHQ